MSAPNPAFSDTEGLTKKLRPITPNLVQKTHSASYSTLSPLRPQLNQSGKTVLVVGASAGIGLAITRAFAEASASKIILTGRRSDALLDAASKLSSEFTKTKFIARVCDVGNVAESAALWSGLRTDGIFVDVLVLNAAKFGNQQSLLEADLDTTWSLYETNVRTILDFTQRLYRQEGFVDRQKFIIYVSTAAIHSRALAASLPTYSISKMSGHLLLQKISEEVDRNKLQIISFHPGLILSDAGRTAGLNENSLPFDNENLPAHWAVWATTSEAAFLHGRFAWAAWDVDEQRSGEVKKRIENDPDFLTVGFLGL
ncbi:Hypothetical protein NCS54_01470400 [Fusarium falciforme]|uniref:Hypothetical protein n=1 Tax=Fusarium falciforme TaxID=195108 RepID=UPI002301620B|nr:Hypothetical protein NCS54_01470400 [Fusarium falciforme]WAO97005.1 Hypothetical protein NCS54_01470400 [Fusarium falciforme]